MATARTYTAEHFAFTLDGVACGFVEALDGGDISADVVETATGNSVFVAKHIGAPKYEDFVAQIGLSMAQPLYDWIEATLSANVVRKNGSFTTADANLNAKTEQQFSNAIVTEVGFPALDAAAKDAAHLTVKLAPELTRSAKASGKLPPAAAAKAKAWTRANFRLELDGLDCSHVKRIDAFAVQLTSTGDAVGDARDLLREPGRIDFPNLSVTIADGPTAASWRAWFEDFVVNGNNTSAQEKSGAIVYLAPDLKTELGRVLLHGVGIFALRRNPLTAGLYCQRMELVVGKKAPAKPAIAKPTQPVGVIAPGKPLGIRR
jgi:phage tail-like protein